MSLSDFRRLLGLPDATDGVRLEDEVGVAEKEDVAAGRSRTRVEPAGEPEVPPGRNEPVRGRREIAAVSRVVDDDGLGLRARLAAMPAAHPLPARNLRACQLEGIANLEDSFAAAHPRALIQMATGAGKTYTACSFTYRLIKHAGARRVLFLVDRSNLGRQAMTEFQQFVASTTGQNLRSFKPASSRQSTHGIHTTA